MGFDNKILLMNRAVKSASTPWSLTDPRHQGGRTYRQLGVPDIQYPMSVHFSPDGTKMYVTERSYNTVVQFNLSTPWDITTFVYYESLYVGAVSTSMFDSKFNADGSRLYVSDGTLDRIYQFNLTTNWRVSTGVYNSSDPTPADTSKFWFNPNGLSCYMITTARKLYRYNLTSAWVITSMSSSGSYYKSFTKYYGGFTFNPDGTKLFISDYNTKTVDEYSLSTAWDQRTATLVNTFDLSLFGITDAYSVFLEPSGIHMYIHRGSYDRVEHFTL